MKKTLLKKLACVGLLVTTAVLSGCGSTGKVAVVDVQRVQNESTKIQKIRKEITNKDQEIQNRLAEASKAGLSKEEMDKKVQDARQEKMIFVKSKQNQIKSMLEVQCATIAKNKDIGIVMHKQIVPAGAIDITDDVVAHLNGDEAPVKKK